MPNYSRIMRGLGCSDGAARRSGGSHCFVGLEKGKGDHDTRMSLWKYRLSHQTVLARWLIISQAAKTRMCCSSSEPIF
jgi:hypothetical protein